MHWVNEHGKEPLLPGINYTQEQLFFLNFAQVGCLFFAKFQTAFLLAGCYFVFTSRFADKNVIASDPIL